VCSLVPAIKEKWVPVPRGVGACACVVYVLTIGATTVETGGTGPQLLGWDQQCIGPRKFLAVVFRKQEI